ncbi:hypothetical protein CLV59_104346 [Chitinophaga dinghuensis]|uniref:Lipoprotein n=1 Tax=Chitinophaga dinghuensis TaxID=1539050 RepID=A0A327VYI8_9BACT|nr:hypothetical protein [Chitinophaga dinghuensis]RAJ82121.1 hypothetical protein CLV59_104346 [Chitinophaga dinghuensis]
MKKVALLYIAGMMAVACGGKMWASHRSNVAPGVLPFDLISASSIHAPSVGTDCPTNITHLKTETRDTDFKVLLRSIFTQDFQ